MKNLTIVIPAKNEAESLPTVLDQFVNKDFEIFVVLEKTKPSPKIEKQLIKYVDETIGPTARPGKIYFVDDLPKTRSGKIMRRLLRAKELGLPIGDTSTLED